jgi:hypothetical protein
MILQTMRERILELADGDLDKGQRMHDAAVAHLETFFAVMQ